MQTRSTEAIKVGLFFFLGLILSYILYETLHRANFYQESGYPVKAVFTDLKQLKIGDEVRLSGVFIGSVSRTKLENDLAVAILNIKKEFKVPKDSVATILNAGLLGANYVAIAAGKSQEDLTSGQAISTQTTPDITSVISQLGKIGERVDGILSGLSDSMNGEEQKEGEDGQKSSFGSLFSNLNHLISSNRESISRVIKNLESITHKVANGEGSIGKLVNDRAAYDQLVNAFKSIQDAAKDLQNLTQDVQKGKGVLGSLISDEHLNQKFKDIANNIDSFTKRLNQPNSTINHLISDDTLYKKAENTLNKIDKATDSMANSGPVSAIGVASKALF